MAAWVCLGCMAVYSVDAAHCPQCGGKKHAEQGSKNDPTLQAAGLEPTDREAKTGDPKRPDQPPRRGVGQERKPPEPEGGE